MNPHVLSREIRSSVTYTLIWTAALAASMIANTLGIVLPARGSGAAYDVAAALASALSGLLYTGPIFAMILGSLVISKEEDDKTIEFLLAHPITRSDIAVSKLLAYTAAVLFLNVVLLAAGLVLIAILGGSSGRGLGPFLGVWLNNLVLMHAFGAAGALLSMYIVKGGAAVGYSIGIPLVLGLMVYLKDAGSDLLRLLSWLSPFRYMNMERIASTGSIDVPFACVTAAISIGLTAASVAVYRKKEFAV